MVSYDLSPEGGGISFCNQYVDHGKEAKEKATVEEALLLLWHSIAWACFPGGLEDNVLEYIYVGFQPTRMLASASLWQNKQR